MHICIYLYLHAYKHALYIKFTLTRSLSERLQQSATAVDQSGSFALAGSVVILKSAILSVQNFSLKHTWTIRAPRRACATTPTLSCTSPRLEGEQSDAERYGRGELSVCNHLLLTLHNIADRLWICLIWVKGMSRCRQGSQACALPPWYVVLVDDTVMVALSGPLAPTLPVSLPPFLPSFLFPSLTSCLLHTYLHTYIHSLTLSIFIYIYLLHT